MIPKAVYMAAARHFAKPTSTSPQVMVPYPAAEGGFIAVRIRRDDPVLLEWLMIERYSREFQN